MKIHVSFILACLIFSGSAAGEEKRAYAIVRDARVHGIFEAIKAEMGVTEPVYLVTQGPFKLPGVPVLQVARTPEAGLVFFACDEIVGFDDQSLRGMFSHELAHILLGHSRKETNKERLAQELDADKKASQTVGIETMIVALNSLYSFMDPRTPELEGGFRSPRLTALTVAYGPQ